MAAGHQHITLGVRKGPLPVAHGVGCGAGKGKRVGAVLLLLLLSCCCLAAGGLVLLGKVSECVKESRECGGEELRGKAETRKRSRQMRWCRATERGTASPCEREN
jgi:hypothetical protein